MKISDLYQNHKNLTLRETIWWVCHLLQSGDTYQAKIQADLTKYPNLRLSTCILNKALKFMVAKKLITSYRQPIKGRGQARKMYQINSDSQAVVKDFANLWEDYYGNLKCN